MKPYLFFAAAAWVGAAVLGTGLAGAQTVSVTLLVNMQGLTLNPAGVHVAGSFQSETGLPADWMPSGTPMSDVDGDGVYAVTVQLPAGTYEYKFLNGNAWGTDESVPAGCGVGAGPLNRGFVVAASPDTVGPFCFGSCTNCNQVVLYPVTFRVNMAAQTVAPAGVFVTGNFQGEAGFPSDWQPNTTAMTDPDADGIYETTVQIPAGTYEYKYVNGGTWPAAENAPTACSVGGNTNRPANITGPSILTAYCFGTCTDCGPVALPDTHTVTFRVSMAGETVSPAGVYVAGNFQGEAGFPADWQPNTTAMADPDGDNVYEVSVQVPAGTYEYKYINGNAWAGAEAVPAACAVGGGNTNRAATIASDTALTAYCFGACTNCGGQGGSPATYAVTFRVNMAAEVVSAAGVHVAGNFMDEAGFAADWSPSDAEMTDSDGDAVFELTVSLPPGTYQYKFLNGNAWGTDESVPAACGVGVGALNRSLAVGGGPVQQTPVCFGTCTPCAAQYAFVGPQAARCAGAGFALPFSVAGAFAPGNVFTAQLADNPQFATPTVLGSLAATSPDTIAATLPAAAGGMRYLRVVSTSPATTGPVASLWVSPDTFAITSTADGSVCSGQPATLASNMPAAAYAWSTGATTNNILIDSSGLYVLAVTDAYGCTWQDSLALSFTLTPSVSIAASPALICPYAPLQLTATGTAASYTWNVGVNAPSITVLGEPGFSYIATAANGPCTAADTFTVQTYVPFAEPLCMATVGSTGKNVVVWNPTPGQRTMGYHIYRQNNTTGLYVNIGSAAAPPFVDAASVPALASSRYKITTVDSCGTELPEAQSAAPHRVMRLTVAPAPGGGLGLAWNAYEGFAYTDVRVLRGASPAALQVLATLPATATSFATPPAAGQPFYAVEVAPAAPCLTAPGDTAFATARSNVVNATGLSTALHAGMEVEVAMQPNPFRDEFSLTLPPAAGPYQVALVDALGRRVWRQALPAGTHLCRPGALVPGLYTLQVEGLQGGWAARQLMAQ